MSESDIGILAGSNHTRWLLIAGGLCIGLGVMMGMSSTPVYVTTVTDTAANESHFVATTGYTSPSEITVINSTALSQSEAEVIRSTIQAQSQRTSRMTPPQPASTLVYNNGFVSSSVIRADGKVYHVQTVLDISPVQQIGSTVLGVLGVVLCVSAGLVRWHAELRSE
jgi:hypothetical protein